MLLKELHHAIRTLARAPRFAVACVITLPLLVTTGVALAAGAMLVAAWPANRAARTSAAIALRAE